MSEIDQICDVKTITKDVFGYADHVWMDGVLSPRTLSSYEQRDTPCLTFEKGSVFIEISDQRRVKVDLKGSQLAFRDAMMDAVARYNKSDLPKNAMIFPESAIMTISWKLTKEEIVDLILIVFAMEYHHPNSLVFAERFDGVNVYEKSEILTALAVLYMLVQSNI